MQSPPDPITRGEHLAFLEVLGSIRANDARWTPTMAGFVTVRLVDKWAEALRGWLAPRPSEVAAVRDAIDKVAVGPTRNALTAIVDAITQSWGRRRSQVSARLLAYAAHLYDNNEWALSADINRTFLSLAHDSERDLLAQVWYHIGWCETWLGRYPEAEAAHSLAREMGAERGERYIEVAAAQGLALITSRRGNLPKAENEFAAVVTACEQHLSEVPALGELLAWALLEQGNTAVRRGDTDRAFTLLGRALGEARSESQRDRILLDLAFAFMEIGLLDTARRAYLVVEIASEDPKLRWIAALNLMHLATIEGAETVFERHRKAMASESLPPRLAVNFNINVGEGYRRFGRMPQARAAFDRAIVLAERHQLNRELIEAETARDAVVSEPVAPKAEPVEPVEWGEATVRAREAIELMSAELAGAGV
jgi:tetratricopeptide (TPR) repeat protein